MIAIITLCSGPRILPLPSVCNGGLVFGANNISNYSYRRALGLVTRKGLGARPLVARACSLTRVRSTCRLFRGGESNIVGITIRYWSTLGLLSWLFFVFSWQGDGCVLLWCRRGGVFKTML